MSFVGSFVDEQRRFLWCREGVADVRCRRATDVWQQFPAMGDEGGRREVVRGSDVFIAVPDETPCCDDSARRDTGWIRFL